MVTETDRNKARSAVVVAYHALDCVTIPFSFLHAFADAAVDAVSTDAGPVGEPLELPYKNWRGEISTRKIQPVRLEFGATEWHPEPQWLLVATDIEKNAERSFALKDFNPQQTAPAVAVKELSWKGPDSSGEYHSLDGLWGYIIRAESVGGFWLTEIGRYFRSPKAAQAAAQADYEARIRSALSAQVQDVAGNEDLDENALSLAAQAYQRKFQDMLGPAPTEEPKAGDGPLGYAIRAYLSSVSVKVQDSDVLESNPETLRWWCQQLLDIIENYDISHDAPEEEIALLNDIRAAVDPASPASKHGDAE